MQFVLQAIVVSLLLTLVGSTVAQDSFYGEVPLYEREPFDQLTLDAANNSAVVDVFPIESLDRVRPPSEVTGMLKIRRIADPPDELYMVNGKNIARVEIFNYLLLAEAKRLLAANKVDDAFHYIARLKNDFPKTIGLEKITESFYYSDAKFLFTRKRYDEALLALNEVFRLNPNRGGLSKVLDRVLSQIIEAEFAAGNYASVRAKLQYAGRTYGAATRSTVASWEKRLQQKAATELAAAKQAFEADDTMKSLAALRRAKETWPSLNGVEELNRTIMARYPRVRVAVTQPFAVPTEPDVTSLSLNWATRRVTPLLARGIVSFKEFTADGGVYESRIGSLSTSRDRSLVNLSLKPEYTDQAYQLSRTLLQLSNPNADEYSPRWSEYLKSVYLPKPDKVQIEFTRPSLIPAALLPRANVGDGIPGTYRQMDGESANFQVYQVREGQNPAEIIREIAEIYYSDASAATDALLNEEVDVIDRVYPPDIASLKTQSSLVLTPYRLPTIHGLVFNDRESLLRNSTFRRGILYGINRAEFVRTEINAGATPPIAQVLSGFAPAGRTSDDPLGYAYDTAIRTRDYDPSLAVVLMRLALEQKKNLASPKNNEENAAEEPAPQADVDEKEDGSDEKEEDTEESEEDKLPELVLAHPDSAIATAGCEAIATDLLRIGITVKLRSLASGRGWPVDQAWDMLYIETTVEEPLADIPELILGHSILGRHGGLVWHATRTLQESSDIEEARNQFAAMHRLTHSHTPMIPLWQIIEHTAARSTVQGTKRDPISLYRNVSAWRLGR